ncbi:unnamed protein product [Chrysodeixis includens]|uniref:Uncharacterized protein n=1 Tax=Chrysodeixis includens TaxID=689277 RepID=A0A9N8Q112_CHRIL|nr:unnamed protein product [Chrysodeixis includens]
MAALLFGLFAVFACQAQALPSPFLPSCNSPLLPNLQPILPNLQPTLACQQAPVVATTIIDNTVSNSLANALQLLIVSNLIENTMTRPCDTPCGNVYTPALDCVGPIISPVVDYLPYNPITTCDIITPCDTVDILPVYGCGCNTPAYPTTYPIGCGCDTPIITYPTAGCGCNGPIYPNVGCGCDTPVITYPTVGCGCNSPSYPTIGCGCDGPTIYPTVGCGCDVPTITYPTAGCGCDNYGPYGLPNYNCGCDDYFPNIGYEILANAFGPRCGPIFPQNLPSCNCVDSCSCPTRYYNNLYY